MFDKPMKFYDDDGAEINSDLIPKPAMCITCAKEDQPAEEHVCILTRLDQKDEEEFHCEAYEPKTI